MTDSRPIGLFDSGIGGLTVLRSLQKALPDESFLYLGDTARLPYGSKSANTIERYIQQNLRFLLAQDVKAVVVACNSASTVILQRDVPSTVPVYNVIEPGAQAAVAASPLKKIGVLGTRATIQSCEYANSILRIDSTIQVFQQAAPLLVPLVEEGWNDDPITNLVIFRYVTPLMYSQVDTVILGCTHYPVLRAAIQRACGNAVTLIDSGEATAERLAIDISQGRLGAAEKGRSKPSRFFVTDNSPVFCSIGQQILPELSSDRLELIDIMFTARETP